MGVPIVAVSYQKQDDMGYLSKFVKERIYTPHPEKHEKEFIEILKEYSLRNGRMFLVPADDPTLVIVSKNKHVLEKYYIVQCTEWDITQRIIDKKFTYSLAEEIGVPSPKTFVAKNSDDVTKYAYSLRFPCLVKPCYSHRYYEHFRKKMVQVNNMEEMVAEVSRATNLGIEVMLQELIIGDDTLGVNYNSFFLNGEPIIEFTSEKVRLSPPAFGVPCVVKSRESISEVLESGRKILKAIGFNGYSCTEFKKDPRDDKYKLLEVNGRHNRSGPLSVKCGINFPWILYDYSVNGRIPSKMIYQNNVYWIDEFRDVYTTGKLIYSRKYSLLRFILPYFKRRVFATFDVRDIKPFLKRCMGIFKILHK